MNVDLNELSGRDLFDFISEKKFVGKWNFKVNSGHVKRLKISNVEFKDSAICSDHRGYFDLFYDEHRM